LVKKIGGKKKMKQFKKYKVKIKLREFYGKNPVRKDLLYLNGKIINVKVLWKCEKGEKYENEYALDPIEPIENVLWLASGDVEVLKGEE